MAMDNGKRGKQEVTNLVAMKLYKESKPCGQSRSNEPGGNETIQREQTMWPIKE